MNWLAGALCIALAIPLSGCGHSIYIVGRETGAKGTARVVTAGNHSGDISIDLARLIHQSDW